VASVTSPGLNSCNRALSMDVVSRSNQFGANSIRIQRAELNSNFHLNSVDLVKVINTKVVSNILIYLQKFFHIILRSRSIFTDFLSNSTLIRNPFWENRNPYSITGQPRPDPTPYHGNHPVATLAHQLETDHLLPQSPAHLCCALHLPLALTAGIPGPASRHCHPHHAC
jgi:hypothetical protein